MTDPVADQAPAGGLDPEPSTRRVASGSPADAHSLAGEPNFSAPVDPADAVFEALKAQISRLWDEDADPARIKGLLARGADD